MLKIRKSLKVFAVGLNKTGTSSIHEVFGELGMHSLHSTHWPQQKHVAFLFGYDAFSDWLDSRLAHLRYIEHRSPNQHVEEGGWGLSDTAVRTSTIMRNDHHLQVLKYFKNRSNDLLVVNYIREPDAAQKIARFLGRDVKLKKPHKHPIPVKRDQSTLRFREQITRVLSDLGVPAEERSYDLFCPSLVKNPNDNNLIPYPDTSMRRD